MSTNLLSFKNLLTFFLLSGFWSVAVAGKIASEENSRAPEATAAEAELAFWDIPLMEQAFIDASPEARNDAVQVGELGVDGGKRDIVVQLAKEVAEGKHGLFDSLLITYKGKLLFESYYRRGRVNLSHDQASAAKSYTSLVLGRAIQMGYLTMADLDKPVVSFLRDLDSSKFVEGAEKITLHKALIMSGGLGISEEQQKALRETSGELVGQGFIQALLERSAPITAESQTYLYGNYNTSFVMQVINAVVPGGAEAFIKKELIDKLGITNYSWENGVSGLPEGGWRVHMTSRDMSKLGSLLANKGKWQGEQLISADYIAKATSGVTKPNQDWMPKSFSYGYYFYQTDIPHGDKIYDTSFAWGGYGQYLIAVEELGLGIVVTAHQEDDTIMPKLAERVIQAFAH